MQPEHDGNLYRCPFTDAASDVDEAVARRRDARPAMSTVALNAALLDRPVVAETHGQVLTYDIPAPALVTIISGTTGTGLKRPYTAANIASRLDALLAGKGLTGVAGLLAVARTCRAGPGAEAAPKPAR